jgi:PAS domain S-box-containing protein
MQDPIPGSEHQSASASGPGPDEIDPRVEAQARLAAIIESSDDAIVSKTLEGIITSWNRGAERIFGWSADEVIGKPITVIIPPDRLEEEPKILERIRSGERVDHFETIRQRKDGMLIDVSVTISPVRDGSGRIIGASKIARDVTLQKRFRHELQKSRDGAEAARLMAEQAQAAAEKAKEAAESANRAKDQFLSVLSHELRTPLTPVLAAVSMLETDVGVPEHLRAQVTMIRRNVETEARLVDDLLDVTRIARGKMRLHFEVVDAHAAIRDVVAMFAKEVDAKSLEVTVSLRAKAHHVWADAARLQQILANLLSNAVKFTPENGSITLRTSNENGTIKMEVIDTGVGIEAEVKSRVFEPFEQGEKTTTRKFGGLGLGLSIVKSLVEMHKGSISVTSEGLNRGSTFTLRIDTVAPTAKSAPADLMEEAAGSPKRILLVEDHADTREVLTRLLRSLGCSVTAVASVKEAIEAAGRETFDLLVSDIGLPDGSGVDVMRHVAQRHGFKGIALSGYGQDEDLRRSRDAGFVTHLIKPVSLQTLHEALKRVGG